MHLHVRDAVVAGAADIGQPIRGGRREVCLKHRENCGSNPGQGLGDRQQERAGSGNHHARPDSDPLALRERLRCTRGEHARQIPAGKRQCAVMGAGRDNNRVCGEGHPFPADTVTFADQHMHGWAVTCGHRKHLRAADDAAAPVALDAIAQ